MSERVEYVVLDDRGEEFVATIVGPFFSDAEAQAEARSDLAAAIKHGAQGYRIIKRTITEEEVPHADR